jgi:hypothetical protein
MEEREGRLGKVPYSFYLDIYSRTSFSGKILGVFAL